MLLGLKYGGRDNQPSHGVTLAALVLVTSHISPSPQITAGAKGTSVPIGSWKHWLGFPLSFVRRVDRLVSPFYPLTLANVYDCVRIVLQISIIVMPGLI